MTETVPLTDFQKECEHALILTLGELGFDIVNRIVFEGIGLFDEDEIYIQFDVKSTGIRLFIYNDEAGIQSPTYRNTFERWDYKKNPTGLINACNKQLRHLLSEIDNR